MNQAIRKLSGLLVLPVLLAALLMMPVRANAEEVPYECFAELPVSVELNGDHDEQFHVTIELAEGMDETAPLPDEAADGLLIAGDASDSFSNFHFTKPGDYVYVVKQEIGDTAYMSYDNTVYTVTIRVIPTLPRASKTAPGAARPRRNRSPPCRRPATLCR